MLARIVLNILLPAALSAAVPSPRSLLNIHKRVPQDFVTTSGTTFSLNGETFSFGGTNAYWATSLASEDLTSLFSQMNSANLKVLRIFGWGDNVGGPEDSSFQYWSGSTNTPNPAAFSAHMDPIISAAEAAGIKLVIPMIGNWGPSINLYIQQVLGSGATHDTFYSDAGLVAAYKTYVNFFVNRYSSSPAIFAWELMNEPRCTGDDNRGASSACDTTMITNWVSEISSYIKSIDSNHMVTVGDEGWFTPSQGYGDSYPYGGSEGIDWVANLKLDSIDYGTLHLYPDSWGESSDWGNTWITQHGQQAKTAGKPAVLEEFGTTDVSNRQSIVSGWLDSAYSVGLAGFQYWQFVSSFPSGYTSPDDGNGISTTEATYSTIESFASEFAGDSGSSGSTGNSSSSSSAGSPGPSTYAGYYTRSASAGSYIPSASAGNYTPSVSAGSFASFAASASSDACPFSASANSPSAAVPSEPASSQSAAAPSSASSASADSSGYILPSNGTASTTQFVLGTELSGGTACGMAGLPSGSPGSSPGTGPGYLYAAINQLAFGANPLGTYITPLAPDLMFEMANLL